MVSSNIETASIVVYLDDFGPKSLTKPPKTKTIESERVNTPLIKKICFALILELSKFLSEGRMKKRESQLTNS